MSQPDGKPKRRITSVHLANATSFGATGLVVGQSCDSISVTEGGLDIVRSTGAVTSRRATCHFVPWANVTDVAYAVETESKVKAA